MNRLRRFVQVLGLIFTQIPALLADAPTQAERDARLDWFRDARFGMFIHWGLYSTLGNEFEGKHGGTYGEHVQRVLKIPIETYRSEIGGKFNPTAFNADEWVMLARDAGMKYLIVTAKHHDGVAMYPSDADDYNITKISPWKRDPLMELKQACEKYGLKFGFYYSHAFDWGTEDGPGNDWDYANPGGDRKIGGSEWWKEKPEFLVSVQKYLDRKSIPQIKELITRYRPDVMWFDTPGKIPPEENARVLAAVRETDPNVAVNGRLVYGQGDYDNTCDTPVDFPPKSGDWEAIPTTNDSYGWNPLNNTHKPASHFIQLLAKSAARGGNLLMNIGPMGDGAIDPKDITILQGLATWWKVNGESIRGTARSPLAVQAWGQSTLKGKTLYLHVFQWPKDGRLVVGGLKSAPKAARLLAAADPLTVKRSGTLDLVIEGLPKMAPDSADSVIALDMEDRDIVADSRRLLQASVPSDSLHVFDATLENQTQTVAVEPLKIDEKGKAINYPSGTLRFGAGSNLDDYVQGWVNLNQSVVWPLRVDRRSVYSVALDYVAEKESDGGEYLLRIGTNELTGVVKETPGSIWKPRSRVEQLGLITLEPGEYDLALYATEIKGKELFKPRRIVLTPKN